MAYLINRFNGSQLTVLDDGTIDTSTDISLVGRNTIGYGEIQNENFVFLLENFSNNLPPLRPLSGQIWYNSSERALKVYNGDAWNNVGSASVASSSPSNAGLGSFWFDNTLETLNLWDGTKWVNVGPDSVENYGVTRNLSTTILGEDGFRYPVVQTLVNDNVISIYSAFPFIIDTNERPDGFIELESGLNLSSNFSLKAEISGTALNAQSLATTRRINGVGFNGTQDITIKSSTSQKLIRGDYLIGADFDGSREIEWSIDASSAASAGKVVARNSAGNFSANEITANTFVGSLNGNVNVTTGTSKFARIEAEEIVGTRTQTNAETAQRLLEPVLINGTPFNGSSNITIPFLADNATGSTLSSNIIFSSLQSLGKLSELEVESTLGIGNNAATDLVVITQNGIRSKQDFDLTVELQGISILSQDSAFSQGISDRTTILPYDQAIDIGQNGYEFNHVYASIFFGDLTGNASTATSSVTATNLAAGGLGAIPYQTDIGETDFLAAGANGTYLRIAGGIPVWDNVALGTHIAGSYITGDDFTGGNDATWAVDATITNTANKIVARDEFGDIFASKVFSDLSGDIYASDGTSKILESGTDGSDATFTGNVIGNATTVTNGIYTTQQYNNPNWITGLLGSKVTQIPNSSLMNSSVTINGTTVNLGESKSIYAGWGQQEIWVDESSNRSSSQEYTNDTGALLYVNCTLSGLSYGASTIATVDGIEVARDRDNGLQGSGLVWLNVGFFVPIGSTYRVDAFDRTDGLIPVPVVKWAELK